MENPRRDKYDVSGNMEAEYVDEAQTVLVNKLGLTDLHTLHVAEEEGLTAAYERLLTEVRTDTPMTSALLQYIHQQIFGDIYEWAGRWRTVQISKPGAIWPPPHYLGQAMRELETKVLSRYPAQSLTDDGMFCEGVAEIQGEFLAIHPFREGNARTVKLLTNLLSVQSGRPLLVYDMTARSATQYIEAAKAALAGKDYRLLTEIIGQALQRGRD